MSNPGGCFAIILMIIGATMMWCSTSRRLRDGNRSIQLVTAMILIIGPAALLLADDWMH